MIMGILGDTHKNKDRAVPHIIREFKKRHVDLVIDTGDNENQNDDFYDGFPVVCALTIEQVEAEISRGKLLTPPPRWLFTRPHNTPPSKFKYKNQHGFQVGFVPVSISKPLGRIVNVGGMKIYVGHRRPWDFLSQTEEDFGGVLNELRNNNDGLRFLFGGHTHLQTHCRLNRMFTVVNPGAVEGALGVAGGHEFAIVDTDTNEVVFSRVLPPPPDPRPPLSIGIISNTLDIAYRDSGFWQKLAKEFHQRGVTHIIHCGNISLDDLGREELSGFEVYYMLRPNQFKVISQQNWHKVERDEPIVEINNYHFYLQFEVSLDFFKENEVAIDRSSLEILRRYPQTAYVLGGLAPEALYIEGSQVITINPGNVVNDRSFVVLCVPRNEITFGFVPVDPLPNIGV